MSARSQVFGRKRFAQKLFCSEMRLVKKVIAWKIITPNKFGRQKGWVKFVFWGSCTIFAPRGFTSKILSRGKPGLQGWCQTSSRCSRREGFQTTLRCRRQRHNQPNGPCTPIRLKLSVCFLGGCRMVPRFKFFCPVMNDINIIWNHRCQLASPASSSSTDVVLPCPTHFIPRCQTFIAKKVYRYDYALVIRIEYYW